jgi:putative transposase
MRKIELANGEYYHIYNRGVDKRVVFNNENDFCRFFQSIAEFNTIDPIGSIFENSFHKSKKPGLGSSTSKSGLPLIEVVCYCFNPNHFHLLLKQVSDKGIEKFMHRLSTGYTKYFNLKNKRTGALFQGRYKAIHIDTNEYFFHLSVYINLNFKVHQLGSSTSKSSWDEYKRWEAKGRMCKKSIITDEFKNFKDYNNFANKTLTGIKKRKELSKILKEIEFGS